MVFFFDELDTGMDFFNSLAETHGADPYGIYHTLYTPLCNLFFLILQMMVPVTVSSLWPDTHYEMTGLRQTGNDIRKEQSCLLIYLCYLVCLSFLWILLTSCKYHREHAGSVWGTVIGGLSFLSHGNLTAIERGNVVNMTAFFVMAFLFMYRSDRRVLRELSYICLAIAAGLRIYPAIFGILLISGRDWTGVAKSMVYGIAAFILPTFALGGISVLPEFIHQVIAFNTGSEIYAYYYGMKNMVYHAVGYLTQSAYIAVQMYASHEAATAGTGQEAHELQLSAAGGSDIYAASGFFNDWGIPFLGDGVMPTGGVLDSVSNVLLVAACVILLSAYHVHDRLWLKTLDTTIAMLLVQTESYDYVLVFFAPALVLMLLEEERADYGNILCILVLFSLTLPYPTLFVHTSRYLTLMRSTAMQMLLVTYIVFQARHVLYVLHEAVALLLERFVAE